MVTVVTIEALDGVVCLHCGLTRISKGEKALMVTNGRGTGYIAIEHKDDHPWTKRFTLPPQA